MNTSGLLKNTIGTIPMDTAPMDSEANQDQKNYKTKMRASGYSEDEIAIMGEKIYPRNKEQLFRYIDMLDFIPCRCGEMVQECYPCWHNRMREEFGGDSGGGKPADRGRRIYEV